MLNRNGVEVGHILSDLVDRELLVPNRRGRWTSYTINENYEKSEEQLEWTDISQKEELFKNETDKLIYDYICSNGFITPSQVIEITNITSHSGACAALKRLSDRDLLKKERKRRQFIYLIK